MSYTARDVVPISEARARLTELSDEVVAGAEKLKPACARFWPGSVCRMTSS